MKRVWLVLLLVACERERREDAAETSPAPEFGEGYTRPPGLRSTPPGFMCTREALAAQASGVVVSDCVVTVDGDLRDCRVVQSIPLLDAMALDVLARWNVGAITYEGRPVAARYKIPMRIVCGPREEARPESVTMQEDTEAYYRSLSTAVRAHFDGSSLGATGLSTDVLLRINEDGTLRDATVTRASGNAQFDELVLNAARSSGPFGPPPRTVSASLRDSGVRLRFQP